MINKKTRWSKECIRCGKGFIATGKSCKVCDRCNTNSAGGRNIRIDKKVKKQLDDIIQNFKKYGRLLNHNMIIEGYLKMTKKLKLKKKLQESILEDIKDKKKS